MSRAQGRGGARPPGNPGAGSESRRAGALRRASRAGRAILAWAREHTLVLALSLAAGILYLPSLDNPFVYDDAINIVENTGIRRLSNIPRFFAQPEMTTSNMSYEGVYRPISTVSYAVDYALARLDSSAYILHNVILHALTTGACVSVARALTGSVWLAAAAGTVFALHPVQTEPVNWATGRATILFSLFYLLSMRLYLAAARRSAAAGPDPGAGAGTEAARDPLRASGRLRLAGLWALSWFLAAAALLSKEMAVTLPAALLLVDWVMPPDPGRSWKRRAARILPYAALAGLYLAVRASMLGRIAWREEYWGGSFWKTLQVMGKVMARYAQLLVLPVGQNLEHVIPIPESRWDPVSILGLGLVAGLAFTAAWLRGRRPVASFGLLWIGMSLLPVSNLIPFYGLIAERHLYLAVPGFGLVVGDLLARGFRLRAVEVASPPRRPVLAALALAALAIAYAGASLVRSHVWSDEILLWEDTVARSPSKLKAHTNLGLAYLRRNRMEAAIEEFHKALQINPRSAGAHANLGQVHLMRNEPEQAVVELRRALEANPRHMDAHKHLAMAFIRLQRWQEAEQVVRKGLELRAEPSFHYLLGVALFKQGRLEEAETELGRALEVSPEHPDALRQMGLIRHRQGRTEEAAEFYRRSLQQAPAPDLYFNLALIDMERGEHAAAADGMARARALAPHIPELALRQAQAEIARDLRGRARPEAVRLLRTENVEEHAGAAVLLRALPDPGGIEAGLAPALSLRGGAEVRAAILATLALLERSRGRVSEARALYEQMLEAGEAATPHLAVGEMALQGADYAAAESHLRRALELQPRLPQAHARLGFLARLRGDPGAALAHFQRALAMAPDLDAALNGRCEALFDLQRWEEARVCFEQRARQEPDHPEAHYYLGRLYQRRGEEERAGAEFSRHREIRGRRGAERGDTAASLE